MSQIPDWMDEIGTGWRPLLYRLHEKLLVLDPYYKVLQVKEKFGGLRAYLETDLEYHTPKRKKFDKAVQEAERTSYKTCELCGESGQPRKRKQGYWIRTVCEEHWT